MIRDTGLQNLHFILAVYARRENLETYLDPTWMGCLLTLVTWLVTILLRAYHVGTDGGQEAAAHVVTFAISTMSIFGVVYSILHISSFLNATVDTFCWDLQDVQDRGGFEGDGGSLAIDQAFGRWNEISSILCSASSTVENSVLALQAVSFTALCFGMIDVTWGALSGAPVGDLVMALSSMVLVCSSISVMLFYASSVTDRCLAVPPLVNSMSFGGDTDHSSQSLLVSFVLNSQAGFYVHDFQMRTSLVLKLHHFYVVGLFVAVFTILPKATSM